MDLPRQIFSRLHAVGYRQTLNPTLYRSASFSLLPFLFRKDIEKLSFVTAEIIFKVKMNVRPSPQPRKVGRPRHISSTLMLLIVTSLFSSPSTHSW